MPRVTECVVWRERRTVPRDPSTLSREPRRNAATRAGGFEYRVTTAQWQAERACRRPKVAKLVLNSAVRQSVQERLAGQIKRPDWIAAEGPQVAWKGRKRGGPRMGSAILGKDHRAWHDLPFSTHHIAPPMGVEWTFYTGGRFDRYASVQCSARIQAQRACQTRRTSDGEGPPVTVTSSGTSSGGFILRPVLYAVPSATDRHVTNALCRKPMALQTRLRHPRPGTGTGITEAIFCCSER